MNDTTVPSPRYEKFYDGDHDNWRIVKYEPADEGELTEDPLATVETENLADMLIAMLDCPVIAINVSGGRVRDILCPADFVPQLRILVVDHDVAVRDEQQAEHTLPRLRSYFVDLPDTEHLIVVAGANYPGAATRYPRVPPPNWRSSQMPKRAGS